MAELTPNLIRDFKEHAVWKEILNRTRTEHSRSFVDAIDHSNERAAGKYRAFETVFTLPDKLLTELERQPQGLGDILRFKPKRKK